MTYEEKVLALLESMNTRLTALEDAIKENSQKLMALEENTNRRFNDLEENTNRRFAALEESTNRRLATLEESTYQRFNDLEESTNQRFNALEEENKTLFKLMDLIASQVNKLTMDMEEVKQKLEQKADKSDIIRLENIVMPKIEALFNGHAQHSEQISRHELILQQKK